MTLWNSAALPVFRAFDKAFWFVYDVIVIAFIERTIFHARHPHRYHVLRKRPRPQKEPDYDLP